MINTLEELINIIQTGNILEFVQNVELKSTWSQECGKKLCGLANKIGQTINWMIVGINDKGELCQKEEQWAKQTEEIISQQINSYLNPFLTCKNLKGHKIHDFWIVVCQVESPGVITRWNGEAYKMAGTTIERMTPQEIMEYTIKLPGLLDYSAQEWSGSYNEDLVKKYATLVSDKNTDDPFLIDLAAQKPEEVLERLRIKNKQACRILFGECQFRVVYYNLQGEPERNISRKGLFNLLDELFRVEIQNVLKGKGPDNKTPKTEEEIYPYKALKEALSNAVAHAAYYENNGDVIIEIHPEKLEISNLCLSSSSYYANKWFSRSHYSINKVLMEALRLAGFVDELGRGKNVIFGEMLSAGKKQPVVNIERAGQYDRWRLILYGGTKDKLQLKLIKRLRSIYSDEKRALVANALVLWRDLPVKELQQYVDGESLPLFKAVLTDLNGPIFYYEKEDRIALNRWVRILLSEGKDSKKFTESEEEALKKMAFKFLNSRNTKILTSTELRQLADMGDTESEKSLTSSLLTKWVKEGTLEKMKRGEYKFTSIFDSQMRIARLSELFEKLYTPKSEN